MMIATLMVTWLDMKRYFITFIDNYLDYALVYLMRNKSGALDKFKVFCNWNWKLIQ